MPDEKDEGSADEETIRRRRFTLTARGARRTSKARSEAAPARSRRPTTWTKIGELCELSCGRSVAEGEVQIRRLRDLGRWADDR